MEFIKVGKIIHTHGIKGDLKIRSMTDFPEDRFKNGATIYIDHDHEKKPFKVKTYRETGTMSLLLLKDLEDINLVEIYKGDDIYVPADAKTTLSPDEYHLSDILGMKILCNGEEVGEVDDVKAYPQGDYLDVLTTSGQHRLVPFRDEFVDDVDLDKRTITVIDMEGLL